MIAFGSFLFACLIEVLQYYDYVKLLGLENIRLINAASRFCNSTVFSEKSKFIFFE